jgi:hypothetical protein
MHVVILTMHARKNFRATPTKNFSAWRDRGHKHRGDQISAGVEVNGGRSTWNFPGAGRPENAGEKTPILPVPRSQSLVLEPLTGAAHISSTGRQVPPGTGAPAKGPSQSRFKRGL